MSVLIALLLAVRAPLHLTNPVQDKNFYALSLLEKSAAVAEAYGLSVISAPLRLLPRKRLTETYLRDPAIQRPDAKEEPIRLVR